MTCSKKSLVYIENGVLRFRKRKQSEWILLLVMLWPFLINLVSNLPSPLDYARYLCDGIILCWFFAGITQKTVKLDHDKLVFVCWICCFLVYTLVAYLLNFQSVLYYLWGIRMNFRGFILFIYVLLNISKNDAD